MSCKEDWTKKRLYKNCCYTTSTDQHPFMLFLSSIPSIQWMQDCFRYWREESDSDEIRQVFHLFEEVSYYKECRSAIRCRNCGGRHHACICMKNLAETIKPATQPSTLSQGANPTKSRNPQANTLSSTTTMYGSTSSGVLLQTARRLICNPNGLQSPLEVRVIFDSGSQKSYITRHTS